MGFSMNLLFKLLMKGGTSAPALPQIGNLVARWSADSITGKADGETVATWTDSVNGFAATQATGGLQPTYKTNIAGGKPSLRFPGTAFLSAGRPAAVVSALDGTACTVIIVQKTLGTTFVGLLFNSGSSGGNIRMTADTSRYGRFPQVAPTDSSLLGVSSVGFTRANQPKGAFRQSINGGIFWVEDTDGDTTAGNAVCFGAAGDSSFFVNADIFEILVWNTALTAPQLLQAEMWIRTKYSQAYPWTAMSDFLVFAGDSITQGTGQAAISGSYPYQAATLLSRPFGTWTNVAVGGQAMSQVDVTCQTQADPIPALVGKSTKLCLFEYYNQRGLGSTAAIAASRTCIANRKAVANMKVVFGTSTSATTDPDATRTAYNASFDGDQTNINAYVPIHNNTLIGISGAAAANPTYFTDGIHCSDLGYATLAPLFVTGINAA
jgi:hypothetical protein